MVFQKIISFVALATLLICPFPVTTHAQILYLEDYQCDYDEVLREYQRRDSIKTIMDLEVLGKMTDIAFITDKSLVPNLIDRILKVSSDHSNPIVAKAIYYQLIPKRNPILWDSVLTVLSSKSLQNDDVFRLMTIGKVSSRITPSNPNCTDVDSILNAVIHNFQDLKSFYYAKSAAYQILSICSSRRGNNEEAIEYEFQRAALTEQYYALCARQRGSSYVSIGRRYQAAGKLDSAIVYFNKSKDFFTTYRPNNPEDILMASVNIASCLDEQGLHLKMIQELKTAEGIAKSQSTKDATQSLSPDVHSVLGIIYNLLGNAYQGIGNEKSAVKYYRKSIAVLESDNSKSLQALVAYANVGENMVKMGQLDIGESYLTTALDLSEKLVGHQHYFTAVILMNTGNMHFQNGDYDLCKELYDESLKIRKSLYGEDHPSLANVYINYAELFESLGLHDKVIEYYDRAIKIYLLTYGPQHPELAFAYLKNAKYYFDLKSYEHALALLEKADRALGYTNDFAQVEDLNSLLDVQYLRSRTLQELQKENTDVSHTEVLQSFEKAKETFDFNMSLAKDLKDRTVIAGKSKDFLSRYGFSLLNAYEETGSENLLLRSLELVDFSKSQGLMQQLNNHAQVISSNLPKSYLDENLELRAQSEKLLFKLNQVDIGSDRFDAILDSIHLLDEQTIRIGEAISESHPIVNRISQYSENSDIPNLQSKLTSDQVVIEFSFIDRQLIAHFIYHNAIEYIIMPIEKEFESGTETFIKSLAEAGKLEEVTLNELEPLISIFNKVRTNTTSVIIIPDGPTLQLPFEALPFKGGFLLDQFAISYANSLNVLAHQSESIDTDQSFSLAAFAPIYDQPNIDQDEAPMIASILRSGNWNLPFAQKEVSNIHALVGGDVYMGSDANKTKLFQSIMKDNVIHLSMHAVMDPVSPLNSRLLFGSTESDQEDLLLYELYNIRTRSPMVVLSACETGAGNYDKGEGVQSLANGFLFAGVPSVVMSLWKVPDETTSQIMTSFYNFLNEGKTKSESLQLAKHAYLENTISPKQKNPFYWAGLVVVGDTSPIVFKSNQPNSILWLGLGIVIILLIIFLRKRLF